MKSISHPAGSSSHLALTCEISGLNPARFVSGYIFVPEIDSGVTNGAGSTHAWMQAYLPGAGRIDFDPTNSIVGNRNLIRVGWDPRHLGGGPEHPRPQRFFNLQLRYSTFMGPPT